MERFYKLPEGYTLKEFSEGVVIKMSEMTTFVSTTLIIILAATCIYFSYLVDTYFVVVPYFMCLLIVVYIVFYKKKPTCYTNLEHQRSLVIPKEHEESFLKNIPVKNQGGTDYILTGPGSHELKPNTIRYIMWNTGRIKITTLENVFVKKENTTFYLKITVKYKINPDIVLDEALLLAKEVPRQGILFDKLITNHLTEIVSSKTKTSIETIKIKDGLFNSLSEESRKYGIIIDSIQVDKTCEQSLRL
jgi:hypothetical protein